MNKITLPDSFNELRFAWLELTRNCQRACTHCYNGSEPGGMKVLAKRLGSSKTFMNFERWKSALDQLHPLGCQFVQFTGGEVTTVPFLGKLVQHADQLGLGVEVFTNASSVPSPELLQVLKNCEVRIATSFYSLDPQVHAEIVKLDDLQTTIEAIRRYTDTGLPVRAGFIEIGPNDGQYEECKAFLESIGVGRVGFDRVRAVGRGAVLQGMESSELKVEQLCGECCDGKMAILPSGHVTACVFCNNKPTGVFSDGLTKIWQSENMRELRTEIFNRVWVPKRFGIERPVCGPDGKLIFTQNCVPNPCDPEVFPQCWPEECAPNSCAPDFTVIRDKINVSITTSCQPRPDCAPDLACKPHYDCSPDPKKR